MELSIFVKKFLNMQISWCEQVWEKSLEIYNRIITHPFITELADGTLSQERFARYLAQDEVYIGNYGRQMYELAELMTDPEQKSFFTAFADSGIESEKAMHQLLIERFNIQEVQASKVTESYNAHTQAAVDSKSKEVAIAAMLPCAWIYNKVGLHILSIAKLDGNPYKEWILEYGNEEFTAGIEQLCGLVDAYAADTDEQTRSLMDTAYLKAAQFEYDFWDYGYRGE